MLTSALQVAAVVRLSLQTQRAMQLVKGHTAGHCRATTGIQASQLLSLLSQPAFSSSVETFHFRIDTSRLRISGQQFAKTLAWSTHTTLSFTQKLIREAVLAALFVSSSQIQLPKSFYKKQPKRNERKKLLEDGDEVGRVPSKLIHVLV